MSTPCSTFTKDPDAVLDYGFDWSAWLPEGDAIQSGTVSVQAGLTAGTVSTIDGVVTIWLSGGTAGQSYRVTCKVVTAQGRTDERSILIKVRDR